MGFLAAKLVWMLLRPSTALLLIGCIGLLAVWLGRRRVGLALVTASIGGFLLALLLPLGEWLLAPLESRFPQPTAPAHIDGLIVLGGAVDTELSEVHAIPSLNDAAERMTTFVALASRHPEARLAFAGGSGLVLPGRLSEAEVARRLFDQLGLDRPVVFDSVSRTTYENALELRARLLPRPGETWVLITSASHMPRAVGVFRKLGWPVLSWPVAYKTGHRLATAYQEGLPAQLAQLDAAAHEWAGLLAYRLLGRTDALFPAPGRPASYRTAWPRSSVNGWLPR